MRLHVIGLSFVTLLCLQGCSMGVNDETTTTKTQLENVSNQKIMNVPSSNPIETISSNDHSTLAENMVSKKNLSQIDNSAFTDVEKLEITDARKPQSYIEVIIRMSEKIKPELATEQAFKQAYGFLQQDLRGADWIRFQVMQGDKTIAEIHTNPSAFQTGENKVGSVLKASSISRMSAALKEYFREKGMR